MPDPFDPVRLAGAPPTVLPHPRRPPRHRPGEKFLRGPVPRAWVGAAATLPGRALAAGLAIWFAAGCKNASTVPVTLARMAELGLSEAAARRAVRELERAGLFAVVRRPGRGLLVTLNDPPTDAGGADRKPRAGSRIAGRSAAQAGRTG